MNALLLLLLDSRAPAGAHHHSGAMEAAISTGLVTGLADLEDFCRARLRTSARVTAAFAASACHLHADFSSERTLAPAPATRDAARIASDGVRASYSASSCAHSSRAHSPARRRPGGRTTARSGSSD
jgi:urease accessory protein